MEGASLPLVTVVMPVRNEAAFIERSLGAVLAQEYPRHCLEVLVADGMSHDGTRDVVRDLMQTHDNLHLVDNPQRIVPTGLNAAIRRARGQIVVRIDGHTIVAPDYVRQCVRALQETGAANVGGPMRAVGRSYVSRAIALATSTPFGIGTSTFHYSRREQYVDTVYMGAFRKEVLVRAGLYDERYVRHQDYELNYRIRRQGGKILLTPRIRSHYFVRDNLRKLARQYWQYGRWKGRFLRAHPASLRPRHLVPPLFVLALAGSALLALALPPLALLPALLLAAYLLFLLLATVYAGLRRSPKHAPLLPLILAILHLTWGAGVWVGLLSPPLARRRPNAA